MNIERMDYDALFKQIDAAEALLASHPGGAQDSDALKEFKSIEKVLLAASDAHAVVVQKASGMVEWAEMLYRKRQPKGYTFERLRIFIAHDLASLRKALEIEKRQRSK